MFKIAHLSDLHFSQEFKQEQVIHALCKDLKRQSSIEPFDVLVFSGDLAAKGDTKPETAEGIMAHFISVVRASVGVEVPILICPGNHDVNLRNRQKILNPIFENVNSPDKANELVEKSHEADQKMMWEHLAEFRNIASAIDVDAFEKSPLYYTKIIESSGLTIGFACLNSAWMTKGGGSQDRGALYIGEVILDVARREIESSDIKIAIMHHPLDWLASEERLNIQRYLIQNFNGLFCGHMHDNNASTLHSNVGSLFTSNTGCIYQNREYFNGYSIIKIDNSSRKWHVSAREYYLQRDEFSAAERFADGGVWEVDFGSAKNGSCISISMEATKAINERCNSLLLSHSASDIAPKSVNAIFVEPPLSSMTERELVAKSKGDIAPKDAYTNLQKISQNENSIFFLGKREAGKSLLLHHIAINCLSNFKSDARLGLVLDFGVLKKLTTASLLEQAVEFCGGEIRRSDLKKILDAGEAVVCIDNFKTRDEAHAKLTSLFISEYPNCRYLFAGAEELVDDMSGNVLPNIGVNCERVFVHSFRSRHTKELVKRWFGSNDLVLGRRIQNVNQLLDRLRVPRTPFLVSVLLWVLEQRPNSNVINKASAIEVLLEGLLEKLKESKARKEVDSNIQQHFLAEFALHLDENNFEWMKRIDFEEFVVSYFKKRGLNVSTDGFATELLRKGLLHGGEGSIGFKFDCFRAFFLARKFAEIPALWKKALTADHVSKYSTELDLFTGLHRDRTDVLRASKILCEENFRVVDINISLDEFEKITDPALFSDKILLNHVENKLLSNNSKIASSENEIPDQPSADHESARRRQQYPEVSDVSKYIDSLRVFSMILRNSELVDDLELKAQSFESALEHWAKTMITAIVSIAETSKKVNFQVNGDSSVNDSELAKKILPMVTVMIPQMIISIMCESLSTSKLEIFVKERSKDSRTLVRLLAVFLSFGATAIESDSLASAKLLFRDYKNNGFILEILFLRLLSFYLSGDQDNLDNKSLRDLIGDILIQLRGGGLKEAAIVKARFLGGLDRNLLMKDTKGE